jgi:hypothetical protein
MQVSKGIDKNLHFASDCFIFVYETNYSAFNLSA